MLDTIRHHLEQYEGQWMLPDDLDDLMEIIAGAVPGEEWVRARPKVEYELGEPGVTKLHSTTARVLEAIKVFWARQGYSPSIRDIGEATGITSTFVVRYHIDKLEQAGAIKRTPRTARSYVPIEKEVKDVPTIP